MPSGPATSLRLSARALRRVRPRPPTRRPCDLTGPLGPHLSHWLSGPRVLARRADWSMFELGSRPHCLDPESPRIAHPGLWRRTFLHSSLRCLIHLLFSLPPPSRAAPARGAPPPSCHHAPPSTHGPPGAMASDAFFLQAVRGRLVHRPERASRKGKQVAVRRDKTPSCTARSGRTEVVYRPMFVYRLVLRPCLLECKVLRISAR
jgi:hypothetical protein